MTDRRRELAVAAAGIAGVLVATALMSPHSGGVVATTTPAMVFLIIVLAAALAGGRIAGLVTAAVAFGAQLYYFVPPDHGIGVEDTRSGVSLAVFALAELTVCVVGASQAEARSRAELSGLRAARLQRFTASLSRALTAEAVYDVALGEGRELLRRQRRAWSRSRPRTGAFVELVATFGFTDEEVAGWRRFPLVAADADRRGDRERQAGLPRRGPARAALPRERRPRSAHGLGAAARRRSARSARSASASSAAMSSTTPSASSRSRSASSARMRSSAPACTTQSAARAAALGLLAAVGEQLARSLEPDAALRTLADLVVPAFADQCVVDLVSGENVRRLVVVNANPEVHEAARVMERYPPALESETPVAVAIRSGVPQVVPSTEDLPDGAYRSPEHRVAVQTVGIRTMLAVPMVVRGRTLGALTFGWQSRTPAGSPTSRSSPGRSRAASASRSTTARSTRRRTASASASPR